MALSKKLFIAGAVMCSLIVVLFVALALFDRAGVADAAVCSLLLLMTVSGLVAMYDFLVRYDHVDPSADRRVGADALCHDCAGSSDNDKDHER